MKTAWREIEIELTSEQQPVWEKAVTNFWLQTATHEYHECPISSPANGKARLPCDPEIVLELVIQLEGLEKSDSKIGNEISRKLAQAYLREKMF